MIRSARFSALAFVVGLKIAASCFTIAALAAGVSACTARADAVPTAGQDPTDGAAPFINDSGPIVVPATDAEVPAPVKTYFFAHTDSTLFKIDADDPLLAPQRIGDFDCVGRDGGVASAMTDIAVDKAGRIVAVARDMIFLDVRIVGTSVVCGPAVPLTGAATGTAFYGATFAPAGVLGSSDETLIVANSDGELYAVDLQSGAISIVGTFGTVPLRDPNGQTYPSGNVGKAWELSGDLVFLDNRGSPVGFATVRDCPNPPSSANCSSSDSLIEIDLTKLSRGQTGNVTKRLLGRITANASCSSAPASSFGRTFGITAYKGEIFGFSRGSLITRISNTNAKACVVADLTGSMPAGFAGAGVSTAAPVEPPR